MPVNTPHKDYAKVSPKWSRMRACVAGQDDVHAAGEAYLPKLANETDANYLARKGRAGFVGFTGRTVQGLKGMLFRKPPVFKVSAGTEKMLEDVTKSGVPMSNFAQRIADEVLVVGRVGVLVDHPPESTAGMVVADVERLNLRPHLAMYTAESIINWAESWVNNKNVTSMVVLQEEARVSNPDEFAIQTETRWRVLDLAFDSDIKGATMAYRVREYRKDGEEFVLVKPPYFPQMNGKTMAEIPFQFFAVDHTGPAVSKPPLDDLANVNLSHYQTTADLEHGAHKTALPQPWIAGIQPMVDAQGKPVGDATFYMGGGHAWSFPSHETNVGMLEFTGAGLTSLENRLAAKERHAAVLGARMLEAQKKEAETAEAAGMHRSGEQATLASQADTESEGLKRVLGWFDTWAGGSGNVEAKINKEFFAREMTPEELTALVASWQQGAISKETLFEKLQKGGVVRDGVQFEEQEAQIEQAAPTLLAQAAAAPAAAPGDDKDA